MFEQSSVTPGEYARFLAESGYPYLAPAGEDCAPVTSVSWYDAVEFARWTGKRLLKVEELQHVFAAIGGQHPTDTAASFEWTSNVQREEYGLVAVAIDCKTGQPVSLPPYYREKVWFRVASGQRVTRIDRVQQARSQLTNILRKTFPPNAYRQIESALNHESVEVGLNEALSVVSASRPSPRDISAIIGALCDSAEAMIKRTSRFRDRSARPMCEALLAAQLLNNDRDFNLRARIFLLQALIKVNLGLYVNAREELEQFLSSGDQDEYRRATALLALGRCENAENTMGFSATGSLPHSSLAFDALAATKHLQEAARIFRKLNREAEEQESIARLCESKVLVGEENVESLFRSALALSSLLPNIDDEIEGLVLCVEPLISTDLSALGRYSARVSVRLAQGSEFSELELEARFRHCIALLGTDPRAAAREAGIVIAGDRSGGHRGRLIFQLASEWVPEKFESALLLNLGLSLVFLDGEARQLLPIREMASALVAQILGDPLPLREVVPFVEKAAAKLVGRTASIAALFIGNATEGRETADLWLQRADDQAAGADANDLHALTALFAVLIAIRSRLWSVALTFLEHLDLPTADDDHQLALKLTLIELQAEVLTRSGALNQALKLYDQAAVLSEELGDVNAAGRIHSRRAAILQAAGSPDALLAWHTADNAFREIVDKVESARLVALLSDYYASAGDDPARALWCIKELDRRIQEDGTGKLRKLFGLRAGLCRAKAFLAGGDLPSVLAICIRVQDAAVETSDQEAWLQATVLRIQAASRQQHTSAVMNLYQQAIDVTRDRGRALEMWSVFSLIGLALCRLRRQSECAIILGEALQVHRHIRAGIENDPALRRSWLQAGRETFEALALALLDLGMVTEALELRRETQAAMLADLVADAQLASSEEIGSAGSRLSSVRQAIREKEVELQKLQKSGVSDTSVHIARLALADLRKQWKKLLDSSVISQHGQVDALSKLRPDAAILELFPDDEGCDVFISLRGSPARMTIRLQDLTRAWFGTCDAQLRGAARALVSERGRDGRHLVPLKHSLAHVSDAIVDVLARLRLVFESVGDRGQSVLDALAVLDAKTLVLIGAGPLASLPLHTVRIGPEGTSLLERFDAIAFAPSLRVVEHRLASKNKRSTGVVAIQDPDGTLEYAPLEADLLALRINDTLALSGNCATRDTVLKAIAGATVVHFACHAAFDGRNPLESGLVLAGGRLSLADVYARGVVAPGSLVVLAACESGLTGLDEPDELIGFPAAFLHAGANTIISTLWPVDDRATVLLVDRFYEEYSRGASAVKSLSAAQLWLSHVSAAELLARASSWLNLGRSNSIRQGSNSIITALRPFDPQDRPFAHPRYWAGFVCTGVDAASWEM